ncbi:MAG: spermidine synthase [Gammaproteobacteria bacterium]|nr:spermidine synthase [Gammaproteobacteria bacterium]
MFEELDYRNTELGELVLRRRSEPRVRNEIVYEVKLGDEFLMSSLFTTGETALADLGLAELRAERLDVVVGGLGLGYTAAAALRDRRVSSLLVIEYLSPVVQWHRHGLLPLGRQLLDDARCRLISGDFFALARSEDGFDHGSPQRRFDAILLDIDHSPRHWLSNSSNGFYSLGGLRELQRSLRAGGVFAMWSNDPVDEDFLGLLQLAFASASASRVGFDNPYTGDRAGCTIYRAYASGRD